MALQTCRRCDRHHRTEARVCPFCGEAARSPGEAHASEAASPSSHERPSRAALAFGALTLAAAAAGLGSGGCFAMGGAYGGPPMPLHVDTPAAGQTDASAPPTLDPGSRDAGLDSAH